MPIIFLHGHLSTTINHQQTSSSFDTATNGDIWKKLVCTYNTQADLTEFDTSRLAAVNAGEEWRPQVVHFHVMIMSHSSRAPVN